MYEQFYDLTKSPFRLAPDAAFHFESASHSKALSYLGEALSQRDGFIVVTGEAGVGKSILVAKLLDRISEETVEVARIDAYWSTENVFLQYVAKAFELDVEDDDRSGIFTAIEGWLREKAQAGLRSVLVVDNCEDFDPAALDDLYAVSELRLGSHPLLQVIMLGQPDFAQQMSDSPQFERFRQRTIAAHKLEALDTAEVELYVHHRLRYAGWGGRPAFADGVIGAVGQTSEGIASRVNDVMDRVLRAGADMQCDTIDMDLLGRVLDDISASPTAERQPSIGPTMERDRTGVAGPALPSNLTQIAASATASEEKLGERDARAAKIEAAIENLQKVGLIGSGGAPNGTGTPHAQFEDKLDRIERRLDEQERTIRHVLTMLIEWFEHDNSREAA